MPRLAPLARTASRLVLLALAAVLTVSAIDSGARAAEPWLRVVYGGKLQDTQGRPIGGVYPLTFNLYRAEKGGKPAWSETHFVAVDNGIYAVELGGKRALPNNLKLENAWLGIALTGGAEIVREKFAAHDLTPPPTGETPATNPVNPANGAVPGTPGANGGAPANGSYAALAGFALEAEKAKTADALGDLPAEQVKALAKSATAPTKAKIGANKRYSDPAGGTGGNPYTLQCPAGYIVTGIKGAAGGYVDSLTLICSPLE